MQNNTTTSASQPQQLVRSDSFRQRVRRLLELEAPRLRRLHAYYQNPLRACPVSDDDAGSSRPYRLGQEWGLPSRITGVRVTGYGGFFDTFAASSASGSTSGFFAAQTVAGVARKEVVIENDIAWRVDTLVDYLFGKPLVITSAACDPNRRAELEQLLRLIIANN